MMLLTGVVSNRYNIRYQSTFRSDEKDSDARSGRLRERNQGCKFLPNPTGVDPFRAAGMNSRSPVIALVFFAGHDRYIMPEYRQSFIAG